MSAEKRLSEELRALQQSRADNLNWPETTWFRNNLPAILEALEKAERVESCEFLLEMARTYVNQKTRDDNVKPKCKGALRRIDAYFEKVRK